MSDDEIREYITKLFDSFVEFKRYEAPKTADDLLRETKEYYKYCRAFDYQARDFKSSV